MLLTEKYVVGQIFFTMDTQWNLCIVVSHLACGQLVVICWQKEVNLIRHQPFFRHVSWMKKLSLQGILTWKCVFIEWNLVKGSAGLFLWFFTSMSQQNFWDKKCDIQALLWPLKSAVLLLHIIISVIHIYDFKNKINSYFITSNFYIWFSSPQKKHPEKTRKRNTMLYFFGENPINSLLTLPWYQKNILYYNRKAPRIQIVSEILGAWDEQKQHVLRWYSSLYKSLFKTRSTLFEIMQMLRKKDFWKMILSKGALHRVWQ